MDGLSVQDLIDKLNQVDDKTKSVALLNADGQYTTAKTVEETNAYGGDSCQPYKVVFINYKKNNIL